MIPCFIEVTRGFFLISIQEVNPVHPRGDGCEVLLYFSLQKTRSHLVQHVAELVVRSWEENRLIDTGGGLKGTEGIFAELSQVLPA